jgi:hypothetical protein
MGSTSLHTSASSGGPPACNMAESSCRSSLRTSSVRAVLAQAAVQMNLSERSEPRAKSGSEFERLRTTLDHLKAGSHVAAGVPASISAQMAYESNASQMAEQVMQVRAMQRAFGVLADTLEQEVSVLRATDAQQWDQLKLHAAHVSEVEVLKNELKATRLELRTAQSELASVRGEEMGTLRRRLDELAAELAEHRDETAALHKGTMADRYSLSEDVGALKRWRLEVAGPFVESGSSALSGLGATIERTLQPLHTRLDEFEKAAKAFGSSAANVADMPKRMAALETEAQSTGAQLTRLTQAQTHAVSRLEERLRLVRDECRTETESHELRLRQAAGELEAHADALRQLNTDLQKTRHEAREEADAVAAGVKAAQTAQLAAERTLADVIADLREVKENAEAASAREAQTLEAVLNLRNSHNTASAYVERVQRELSSCKTSASTTDDTVRGLLAEIAELKASRGAVHEMVDERVAEVSRHLETEQHARVHLGATVDTLRRDTRFHLEAVQHAHNRLREHVDLSRAAFAADARRAAHDAERDGESQPIGSDEVGGVGSTSLSPLSLRFADAKAEPTSALLAPPPPVVTPALRSSARLGSFAMAMTSPATARLSMGPSYTAPSPTMSVRSEPRRPF